MPESRVGCEMQGHEIMHISILDPRQLPCAQTDPHLIRKILCIVQQRTQGWSTIRTTRGDGYPTRGGGVLLVARVVCRSAARRIRHIAGHGNLSLGYIQLACLG